MLIEKRYFDIAKREDEEIEMELEAEKAKMTEEEKLEEKTNIYVNGISAPRGRILDTNGKVLVDNIGVKTIYYNKIK